MTSRLREGETDRQTQRDSDRQREEQRDRQTDRDSDRDRERSQNCITQGYDFRQLPSLAICPC